MILISIPRSKRVAVFSTYHFVGEMGIQRAATGGARLAKNKHTWTRSFSPQAEDLY